MNVHRYLHTLSHTAQVKLIRSTALSRVRRRLGFVPEDLMRELDARIRLHLAL